MSTIRLPVASRKVTALVLVVAASGSFGQAKSAGNCSAQSGPFKTPVIELYTSEGCSSCPPADKWLSRFKSNPGGKTDGKGEGKSGEATPVIQAFHVGYWDYIGWVDRFATPAHTTRQRQVAALNRQSSIYTPQAVLDGRDWRDWQRSEPNGVGATPEPAQVAISLRQLAPDQFEALVTPALGHSGNWAAYWTLTEDGHSSKVKSGENAGEFLQHDFVVRQYTQAGEFNAASQHPAKAQKLNWRSIAATPGHLRRINLVVYEPKTGKTLQAVSVICG